MTRIALVAAILAFAGCASETLVEPTAQWEGHFYSFDELKSKIDGQQLEEKQSMWLLSNTTLKRLLKEAGAR